MNNSGTFECLWNPPTFFCYHQATMMPISTYRLRNWSMTQINDSATKSCIFAKQKELQWFLALLSPVAGATLRYRGIKPSISCHSHSIICSGVMPRIIVYPVSPSWLMQVLLSLWVSDYVNWEIYVWKNNCPWWIWILVKCESSLKQAKNTKNKY